MAPKAKIDINRALDDTSIVRRKLEKIRDDARIGFFRINLFEQIHNPVGIKNGIINTRAMTSERQTLMKKSFDDNNLSNCAEQSHLMFRSEREWIENIEQAKSSIVGEGIYDLAILRLNSKGMEEVRMGNICFYNGVGRSWLQDYVLSGVLGNIKTLRSKLGKLGCKISDEGIDVVEDNAKDEDTKEVEDLKVELKEQYDYFEEKKWWAVSVLDYSERLHFDDLFSNILPS